MLRTSKKVIQRYLHGRKRNQKFSQKKFKFSSVKAKTSSTFVLWQPDEICRFNPKIIEITFKKLSKHQINQSERKFSQKKYVWYLKSVKEPKNEILLRSLKNIRTLVKLKKP
jgi:hypothetical protein